MKITRMRTEVVQLPFDPVIGADTPLPLLSADCILVFLDTDAGLTGEGLALGLNGRGVKAIHAMVRELEPLVIGVDPELGGSLAARAWRDITFLGHAGVSIMGLAGVDAAMWDLRGKAANLNVSRLIGAIRPTVPVYNSGALWVTDSIDVLQKTASRFMEQGFKGMKMRLGKPDPHEDAARVKAVRDAIGPDIALMADSNQRWSVPQAIRLGRLLEEYNLTWFEEPVSYMNHAGEAEVSAALDMPVASGETEYTQRGMLAMLQARSADILIPDLQRMGGPTGFLKAAAVAEAFDTPVASHLFTEMNLALLAAVPNAYYLEYIPWVEALYTERLELDANGQAVVPTKPGWGFSFDQKAIERYRR